MEQPPEWLDRLRADPEVAALGVAWGPGGKSDGDEEVGEHPLGVRHTDFTLEYHREHFAHMVRVASGPAYTGQFGVASEAAWFVDSREPERLLLAPAASYPVFLWIPAEPTAAGMRRALDGLFPSPKPVRVTLPKSARGFMGYAQQIGVPNVYDGSFEHLSGLGLDRFYTLSPFTNVQSWGSAVSDDPYPEEHVPPLVAQGMSREYTTQVPGVPSMTWRTTASGSYLSIEAHAGELFIADVRYRPSPHPQVIERVNAAFGSTFPVDLPVDVVGALIGFDFRSLELWEEELAEPGLDAGDVLGKMEIAVALAYGNLDALARLRRYFEHERPGVRAELLNYALRYNLEFLAEELLHTEPEVQIVERGNRILDQGPGNAHPDIFEDGGTWNDFDEDDDD